MKVWISLLIYVTIVYFLTNILKIKNKNKWFLIFVGIGIIFVMGSRKYIGGINDVVIYYNYYNYNSPAGICQPQNCELAVRQILNKS